MKGQTIRVIFAVPAEGNKLLRFDKSNATVEDFKGGFWVDRHSQYTKKHSEAAMYVMPHHISGIYKITPEIKKAEAAAIAKSASKIIIPGANDKRRIG